MAQPSTAVLDASDLQHRYRPSEADAWLLDGVSLTVAAGESVAIAGQSGSGKSTLLNLLGGLEPIQHGRISVFGQTLVQMDDRARTRLRREQIGFVYQAFNLIPTLSVGDNITLPLALAGADRRQRERRLSQLLDAVGLQNRQHDSPEQLSGGEQQRVAIARALAHEPPLILADEPTGNLDAHNGRQALALLRSLVRGQSSALVLVTHSLEVAQSADRALVLANGQLHPIDAQNPEHGMTW